ncbi:ribose 5-phosphate isomerase A [Pedobacter psychroterrae]|uniref:Ribose 5-phosphate isomerase A n=1 Tax=Pedobacter psychroterrae TaxID=2530453 RepID=A0A4R0NHX7_9SPHI|nr:ribose 5-phosphate isomerase A [Pedobacter psychroterrae]TCC98903.1 ribose 5-phosphate isomerase A [Pedobacter psychroterrae]
MDWNSSITNSLWPDSIQNRESKEKVAEQIANKVKDGDTIGVGSGSTSYLALLAIAQKIKTEALSVRAIPTSIEIALTCISLGIPVVSLQENRPDWYFDGADEVDPNNHLIKGRGGAMFKEKLIMSASSRNYIIIDKSKLVEKLGAQFPVPVEVFPSALMAVEAELKKLGATKILLRPAQGKDGPIISENGNLILDVRFDQIDKDMETKIKCITGVIESGLFQNLKAEIIIA